VLLAGIWDAERFGASVTNTPAHVYKQLVYVCTNLSDFSNLRSSLSHATRYSHTDIGPYTCGCIPKHTGANGRDKRTINNTRSMQQISHLSTPASPPTTTSVIPPPTLSVMKTSDLAYEVDLLISAHCWRTHH